MAVATLSVGTRHLRSQALEGVVDLGTPTHPYMEFRTGSAPPSPDSTATGTLLATLICSTPFGTVSGAGLTMGAVSSGAAVASGTVGYVRLYNGAAQAVMDMDVGLAASGASVQLNNTVISTGDTVSISSGVMNEV